MTMPVETSDVEGVGNRERGNIQTHRESKTNGKKDTKGRHKSKKNTHSNKSN